MIAEGTKEELKNMIKTGGTVEVSGVLPKEQQLAEIAALPHVFEVSCQKDTLLAKCTDDKNGLLELLHYLDEQKLPYAGIVSRQPTLNDVFLEITGKELRD